MVFARHINKIAHRSGYACQIDELPSDSNLVVIEEDDTGRILKGPSGKIYEHIYAGKRRRSPGLPPNPEQFFLLIPEEVMGVMMGMMPKRSSLAVKYGYQK
jgi:hypothetical protein